MAKRGFGLFIDHRFLRFRRRLGAHGIIVAALQACAVAIVGAGLERRRECEGLLDKQGGVFFFMRCKKCHRVLC